jgi:hypothetical protein
MTTQESNRTRKAAPRSRRSATLVAVAVIAVGAGIAVVAWLMTSDGGPVAADEAQIEMVFTGDGTSHVGDHEIVEGMATITFSNETTGPVTVMAFGYETGSAALAEELELLEEGESGMPTGVDPAEGFFDPSIGGDFEPGHVHLRCFDRGRNDHGSLACRRYRSRLRLGRITGRRTTHRKISSEEWRDSLPCWSI